MRSAKMRSIIPAKILLVQRSGLVALNRNSPRTQAQDTTRCNPNMDIYRFCEHCNKRVSEKTFKEHRRLYFHEGKWLFTREDVEARHHRSDSDDSSALSISLPESVPDNSSVKIDSEISINPEDVAFDGMFIAFDLAIH